MPLVLSFSKSFSPLSNHMEIEGKKIFPSDIVKPSHKLIHIVGVVN